MALSAASDLRTVLSGAEPEDSRFVWSCYGEPTAREVAREVLATIERTDIWFAWSADWIRMGRQALRLEQHGTWRERFTLYNEED